MTIFVYLVNLWSNEWPIGLVVIPTITNPMIYIEVHPLLLLINRNSVVKMMDCLNEVAMSFSREDTSPRYARFHLFEMTLTLMVFLAIASAQCYLLCRIINLGTILVLIQSGLVSTLLSGLLAMIASALHTLKIRVKRMRGISDFETAVRDYERIADAAACFEKICNINCSVTITKCFIEMNICIFFAFEKNSFEEWMEGLGWAAVQLWIIWRLIIASVTVGDQAYAFYSQFRVQVKRQGLDEYVPHNAILYMFLMRRTRIKFTGFGMFKLDKKFFGSVILATSTYTIMLRSMIKLQ
ncbi:Hypothetical protein NTJ_09186 [Nesidiocoris tenuis]|uniref:Gustatory receptor n=1 Tax=Nesidiocoris tenuis TaxID=355587 RepID=A0ABN7AZQ1_9HEMI|nr:Hypothetical protein NTJ_09186 [Nesidiocoris tenuis]